MLKPSGLHKATAEALRTIWTNIQFSSIDRPIKQILLTGVNPKCDPSTIVVNLGATIASFGNTVLLVDADLRRPILHNIFNINNKTGLTSLLFDKVASLDTEQVLYKSINNKTGLSSLLFEKVASLDTEQVLYKSSNNLAVLTSGPIPLYPTEMLVSDQMKSLSAAFAEKFDYVVYNSPPLNTFTDATVLSKIADGTILAINYGQANQNEAVNAVEQLHKIEANVIGMIINNIPRNKSHIISGYYYYDSDGDEHEQQTHGVKNLYEFILRKLHRLKKGAQ